MSGTGAPGVRCIHCGFGVCSRFSADGVQCEGCGAWWCQPEAVVERTCVSVHVQRGGRWCEYVYQRRAGEWFLLTRP